MQLHLGSWLSLWAACPSQLVKGTLASSMPSPTYISCCRGRQGRRQRRRLLHHRRQRAAAHVRLCAARLRLEGSLRILGAVQVGGAAGAGLRAVAAGLGSAHMLHVPSAVEGCVGCVVLRIQTTSNTAPVLRLPICRRVMSEGRVEEVLTWLRQLEEDAGGCLPPAGIALLWCVLLAFGI